MSDALASDDGIIAVLDPGIGVSSVSIRQDGRECARFEAAGGAPRIPELLGLAAASFDVDEWFVDVTGFQAVVLELEPVVSACTRLGIILTPYRATALEPWGPGLEVRIPSSWPERLGVHPLRRLVSWLSGATRWSNA